MKTTPWFPQWLHRLAPMGQRAAGWLTHVRQCTLSKLEDRCAQIFSDPVLQAPSRKDPRRERPYSLRRTFWCFLWQILNENTSCRDVVRQLQAVLALHGILNLDEANSAYCQARIRLPGRVLRQSWHDSAQATERQAPERHLLQGRGLKAADGSTLLLADTPANQKQYPQQKGQKPGCGFPIMRLSVVFSLHSGAVVDIAQGNYYQHELRLFHTLHPHLHKGEIVVYDRAGGHFVWAASLRHREVDLISRVLKRHMDGRRRLKRLGQRDWLMGWKKGPQKPAYLSEEEWAALPAEITVRVLKVTVSQKGCRTQELTLMTTLLDPELYPAHEIAQAYCRRWRLELCLDDLKTTLGMDPLRCQSPAMVEKELLMFLIAHKGLRWVMAQAAREHEVDLDRISFTGALDAFREFATAMAQAKPGKKRPPLWETLLRTLANDLVPERPGRREPRAVKRRPKPYPLLNKPRHQFREDGRRAYCKPMSYN